MINLAYNTLNFTSAVLIGALGMVIACVGIPATAYNRHYRTARVYLSLAFILLSALKLVELFVPKQTDTELTACIALSAGAFQAFCFTTSLLLFIQPKWVTRRRSVCQFTAIAIASTALLVSKRMLPETGFHVVLDLCALLYVTLLGVYTWIFNQVYRNFKTELYDYYQEEDLTAQLRWISHTFYMSLAVGCLVLLSLSGMQWLDNIFVAIYSVFYVYLTISFINYGRYVTTVMRAMIPEADNPAEPTVAPVVPESVKVVSVDDTPTKYAPISAKLKQWVEQEKYLLSDVAVKDVAAELGSTPRRLNEYFNDVVGEDFVKWRIRLRLQHACALIEANPDRSIQEIALESGFGDRSYFYRKFAELQGLSVTEYKRQAKLRKAQQL